MNKKHTEIDIVVPGPATEEELRLMLGRLVRAVAPCQRQCGAEDCVVAREARALLRRGLVQFE